ncbi:hypothetical protein ACFLXC_06140 [Chloroflexota bacterium]
MAESKYEKNLVQNPLHECGIKPFPTTGRQIPTMTYMGNDLVPNCNTYIEIGWIWEMPTPNPQIFEHVHEYNELVLHLGTDPENPEELNGEIEFGMGDETVTINKTSALFVPKGVKHGPLKWNRVDKPHLLMTIMLGAGTLAQAKPGGYGGKKG